MFFHEKKLFHPVEVERPNPQYAVLMQEQLGGGNGEMKAAMQYMSQSFRIKDKEINLKRRFNNNRYNEFISNNLSINERINNINFKLNELKSTSGIIDVLNKVENCL